MTERIDPAPSDGTARTVALCGQRLPHPGHVCAFFDSRDQQYEILLPFFEDAIEAGDIVFNIVDAADYDVHVETLSRGNPAFDHAVASGQFTVRTSEETYLNEDPDTLDRLLAFLRETLATAAREGRSVRTCGEMNWISRSRLPVTDVLEYEARVNYLYPSHACTLVCAYDMAKTPASLMADILATHPYAIVKGRLRENPFFVQPDEYLRMLKAG